MARIADPNSKRQRAWAIIRKQPEIKRAPMLVIIMEQLDVSKGYANTLFESFRTEQKIDGSVVETYIVKDVKDGYNVTPYISTKFVQRTEIKRSSPTSTDKAFKIYEKDVAKRLKVAKKICA